MELCNLPQDKYASTFLRLQTKDLYKEIDVYASQLQTPSSASKLTFAQITTYMNEQYSPKKYIIRERYKFWSSIKRKPNESPCEQLAARIRKSANLCDFSSVSNPLQEPYDPGLWHP